MSPCLKWRRRTMLAALVLAVIALTVARPALAADPAEEKPILHLENADGSKVVELSLADLQALGRVTFDSSTPWTDGAVRFEGVPLSAVLDTVRGTESRLQAAALNDYAIEMPIEEILPFEPVLAWARDGRLMSVRNRGPLWLVFDFDRFPETRNETFLARSIWQLKSLRLQQ
ncbi:hypothetical protein ACFOGJ_16395 [Marinibaculum pumilum]|uniref:Oxidoreductase n=1 Tax=Marinibaculum pumilum TaxID=1766165 RepID=A0ABV7L2C4_9PROT